MKDNEYQCANCGNIYEKGWTDEEAAKEMNSNFPSMKNSNAAVAVICDDCYKKIFIASDGFTNPPFTPEI